MTDHLPNNPDCPDHKVPMPWHDDTSTYRCMEPGCKWKASPRKEDTQDAKPPTNSNWPEILAKNTIYQGVVELVIRPDVAGTMPSAQAVYLRLVDQDVMIDITPHFMDVTTDTTNDFNPIDPLIGPLTPMHGFTLTKLQLRFNDVRYFT